MNSTTITEWNNNRLARRLASVAYSGLRDRFNTRFVNARVSMGTLQVFEPISGQWFPVTSYDGWTDCNGRPVDFARLAR